MDLFKTTKRSEVLVSRHSGFEHVCLLLNDEARYGDISSHVPRIVSHFSCALEKIKDRLLV